MLLAIFASYLRVSDRRLARLNNASEGLNLKFPGMTRLDHVNTEIYFTREVSEHVGIAM